MQLKMPQTRMVDRFIALFKNGAITGVSSKGKNSSNFLLFFSQFFVVKIRTKKTIP